MQGLHTSSCCASSHITSSVYLLVAVQAQQLYGQSFMCLSMATSELNKIAQMASVSFLLLS